MSIIGAVLGVGEMTAAILGTAGKLAVGARQVDDGAAARMVQLMQDRVPRRTGRLQLGITARFENNQWVVQATASNPTGRKGGTAAGADYARFVEFGTAPRAGKRVVDDDYFAGGGHPGTDPQPYFWNSGREVLGERFAEAERMVNGVAL